MRTLNRPMFRYGGPIKEGVMNGIRENKRQGGSMGNNQGPRRAALVGNPAYPQTDGRAHHLAPLVVGGLYAAGRALARPFGSWAMKQMAKKGVTGGGGIIRSGLGRSRVMQPGESLTQSVNKFTPNWLGKQFINDPLAKSVMTGSNKFGKGIQWTGKKIGGIGKYAFGSPSGLLFMGLPVTYHAGKYFLSDGKEITGKNLNKITQGDKRGTSGAPGGGDPDMTYTAPEKELTAEEIKAAEAKARNEKMESYREIMDIKGMSKNAAYKSLVDASKIIQEGGNLKEQLKSGSLISKLTQAASKRFDKVSDTESALRSLVAKGEIQKEMNKDENQLSNDYKRIQIALGKKGLAGNTLSENLSEYRIKNNKNASGSTLAGFVQDQGQEVVAIADTVKVDKHIKGGGTAISYMENIVVENLKNNKEVAPGVYVVKDTLIHIDENGQVSKVKR